MAVRTGVCGHQAKLPKVQKLLRRTPVGTSPWVESGASVGRASPQDFPREGKTSWRTTGPEMGASPHLDSPLWGGEFRFPMG